MTYNVCAFVSVPSSYDCSFESGLCQWTQDHQTDKFDWTRTSGSTRTTGTGPSTDHTLGNSMLLFFVLTGMKDCVSVFSKMTSYSHFWQNL